MSFVLFREMKKSPLLLAIVRFVELLPLKLQVKKKTMVDVEFVYDTQILSFVYPKLMSRFPKYLFCI